jgi:hypothetical protein
MLPAKDRHARDGIGPQLVEATGSIDHLRLWPIRMIAVAKANSNTFIRKMQQSIAMSSSALTPIIELREYAIKPECSTAYVEATRKAYDLRKSLVPIRLFSFPDTGG